MAELKEIYIFMTVDILIMKCPEVYIIFIFPFHVSLVLSI